MSAQRDPRTALIQATLQDSKLRSVVKKSAALLRSTLGYATLSELTTSSHPPFITKSDRWLNHLLTYLKDIQLHLDEVIKLGILRGEVGREMREKIGSCVGACVEIIEEKKNLGGGGGLPPRGRADNRDRGMNRGWRDDERERERGAHGHRTRPTGSNRPSRSSDRRSRRRHAAGPELPPGPTLEFTPVSFLPQDGFGHKSSSPDGAPASSSPPPPPRIRVTISELQKDCWEDGRIDWAFLRQVLTSPVHPEGEVAAYNACTHRELYVDLTHDWWSRKMISPIVMLDSGESFETFLAVPTELEGQDQEAKMQEYGWRKNPNPPLDVPESDEVPNRPSRESQLFFVVNGIDALTMSRRIKAAYSGSVDCPGWNDNVDVESGERVLAIGIPLRFCIRLFSTSSPTALDQLMNLVVMNETIWNCMVGYSGSLASGYRLEMVPGEGVPRRVYRDIFLQDQYVHRDAVSYFIQGFVDRINATDPDGKILVGVETLGAAEGGWDVRMVHVKVEDIDRRKVFRFRETGTEISGPLVEIGEVCAEWKEKRIECVRLEAHQAEMMQNEVPGYLSDTFVVHFHFVCDDPMNPEEVLRELAPLDSLNWATDFQVAKHPQFQNIFTVAISVADEDGFKRVQELYEVAHCMPFFLTRSHTRCVMMREFRIVYGVGLKDCDPAEIRDALQDRLNQITSERDPATIVSVCFGQESGLNLARIVTDANCLGSLRDVTICGKSNVAFFDYFVRAVDVVVKLDGEGHSRISRRELLDMRMSEFAVWMERDRVRCYYPGTLGVSARSDPQFEDFKDDFRSLLDGRRLLRDLRSYGAVW